ncbi:hypothetical protein ACIRG4_17970 [Streptomyces sp. NPDC102395]|uniref:hypothetical protein n=1 Tax=Streptomyces sp. NPDC102395 TaxID=3366168 RepID=UPI003810A037
MALHRRREDFARLWTATLTAPLGLVGHLLWVGNRMGDLRGYFVLQTGAWGHTFDYEAHTLDVLTSVAVGRHDYVFAAPFEDVIGVLVVLLAVLLLLLLIRLRPPAVLVVYTPLTFALALGSRQIFGNVSRYPLPAFPLFIPPALTLRRLGLPTLMTLLGITAVAPGSCAGYAPLRAGRPVSPEPTRQGWLPPAEATPASGFSGQTLAQIAYTLMPTVE